MRKSRLLIAAAAAIVICSSAYAGITVMADDSTTATTAVAKDEVILSAEDLTEANLDSVDISGTYGYGIYANADKSLYTIVSDDGNKVSTIKNSDSSIARIAFSTGCYANNVVLASNTDGKSTLLNLDGSYYSKITGYYNGISMQSGITGRYLINDGTNVTFYEKDGTKLFQIAGTGTITWSEIKGYNVLDGTVGGVTYRGVYDNNLTKIYEAVYLGDNGKYAIDDGTNTIFYGKDNIELFRVAITGSFVLWSDFNGYNILHIYDYRNSGTTTYFGLYNNKLEQVITTPPYCVSIYVTNGVLKYSCYENYPSSIYYYYDSNLKACGAPVTTTTSFTLAEEYKVSSVIKIDDITFVIGYKSDTIKHVTNYALFNLAGERVYNNFTNIYRNGLCVIKDETTGKLKLTQLSAKTLDNATKNEILPDSNKIKKANISVTANTNSADATVSEKLDMHIEAAGNIIPDGAFLCAATLKASDGERFVRAQNALANIASKFTVFDIDLLSASNMKVQPDGTVKITITIPSTYATSALKVYRIETDGTKTDMKATIVDGTIAFETNHFSIYVLSDESAVLTSAVPQAATQQELASAAVITPTVVAQEVAVVAAETTVEAATTPALTSPATFDRSPIILGVIIAIVAAGCFSTMLSFNKKKYNEE